MQTRGQPAVRRAWHGGDQRVLDLQRRGLRRRKTGERILEERLHRAGGRQFPALDFDVFAVRVVGAHGVRRGAEIAERVDDDHRCRFAADCFAGVAGGREQLVCRRLIERQHDLLVLVADLDHSDRATEFQRQVITRCGDRFNGLLVDVEREALVRGLRRPRQTALGPCAFFLLILDDLGLDNRLVQFEHEVVLVGSLPCSRRCRPT